MLDPHFVGNARFRQPHELGEGCMRPAGAAGQRRDQAGDRGVAVAIERAQVNVSCGAAGGAIDPQEMMAGPERGVDRWCEQKGHVPGLALVPSGN